MINIHTARVFIPYPTGWTRESRTFGINVRGYNKDCYNIQRNARNLDDVSEMAEFYDVISAHYGMNLSKMPNVVPFVQYIDYMKSIGGGFSVNNADVIEHLKTRCNTLIITDEGERDYIEELYLNILRKDIGLFKFNPAIIPARFKQKVR